MVPFGARSSPGGSAPAATDHEYGAKPPLAASELVYGTPMVPTERAVVVTLGGADRVSMVPPKFEAAPVATQLAEVAHDTPRGTRLQNGGGSVGPGDSSVSRAEDARPTDRRAGGRADAAHGRQGGRPGRSSQVVPVRSAVRRCRSRGIRSPGTSSSVEQEMPSRADAGRSSLRCPGGAAVRGAEDRCSGAARRRTHRRAVHRVHAGDAGEIADGARECLRRPHNPAVGGDDDAG